MNSFSFSELNKINLEDFYEIRNITTTNKLLINRLNLNSLSISEDELIELFFKVDNAINTESDQKGFDYFFLKKHQGGKQTSAVYEAKIGNTAVAIKIYKPILTHLILHTISSDFLTHSQEIDIILEDLGFPGKIYFPRTLGIKLTDGKKEHAILVQEWVDHVGEIHKKFPDTHARILKKVVQKVAKNNLIIDMMTKNWLICKNNNLHYIDLLLFRPEGEIIEKIKDLTEKLS